MLFTIPLRRALIVEQQLAYPEGTATAEVLKVGDDARAAARCNCALAALLGAAIKFAETGFRLWPGTAQAATYVGGSTIAYVGTNLSPALLGVGYIVGLEHCRARVHRRRVVVVRRDPDLLDVVLGQRSGVSRRSSPAGRPATDLAGAIWATRIRYLGVGAMLIGGVWALLKLRKSIWSGISSEPACDAEARRGAVLDHRDQDVPLRLVLGGIVLFVLPICRAVLRDRRHARHRACDDDRHGASRGSCSRPSAATWRASSARRTTRFPASRSRRSC